ncbi:unnamed protein product [marine sediment metagenome]|uniref:Uncharacterized protein n=1 Tax=marine sediment metagenome TaxID=412755 RepID=X0W2N5_9ZZZZ
MFDKFNKNTKKTMSKISSSQDIRETEEMIRPRIEMEQDGWVDWVSTHERKKRESEGMSLCDLPWMKSSPLCGRGHH